MSEHESAGELAKRAEVERKFLVAGLPEGLESLEQYEVHQGYLAVGEDGSEARLRHQNGSYTLTVKSSGDLSRDEWEVDISEEQFSALWGATSGRRVEKIRYFIPYADHTIELDVYEGALAGLVTAEVEFESEAVAMDFEPPDWFAAEVTSDSSLKNHNLAVNGLSDQGAL